MGEVSGASNDPIIDHITIPKIELPHAISTPQEAMTRTNPDTNNCELRTQVARSAANRRPIVRAAQKNDVTTAPVSLVPFMTVRVVVMSGQC